MRIFKGLRLLIKIDTSSKGFEQKNLTEGKNVVVD